MIGSDTDGGGTVEVVWGDIACEFCTEDPKHVVGEADPYIGRARWAVVVKDCCQADAAVDYLICEGHWALYRDRLVGICDGCGTVARHYTESVWTVQSIGRVPVGFTRRRRHRWTRWRRI